MFIIASKNNNIISIHINIILFINHNREHSTRFIITHESHY
jgi:hypothetical protein